MVKHKPDKGLEALIAAARDARAHAHVPLSGYAVGAAIRAEDGRIFSGCNVENDTYSLTTHGEEAAISAFVRGGGRRIVEIAIVTQDAAPPCGACRQRLAGFAGDDLVVHLCDAHDLRETTRLGDLLPRAFRLPRRTR